MTAPKYNDVAYRRSRQAWAPIVASGQASCHEPICLMPDRHIAPGSQWHLSHDPTGTQILGPSHARCNIVESNERRRAPKFLRL